MAGLAAYRAATDVLVFTQTEVDRSYEGKGVGSRLVREALDDVRSRDLRVVPLCPFVKGWIDRHLPTTTTSSTARRRAPRRTEPGRHVRDLATVIASCGRPGGSTRSAHPGFAISGAGRSQGPAEAVDQAGSRAARSSSAAIRRL